MTLPKKKNSTEKNEDTSPDPVDVYVGKRLHLRRNSMAITQEQLGKAAGLTFQQIQKYERGSNRIAASRLYHISRFLKVDVDFFFNGFERSLQLSNTGFSDGKQQELEGAPSSASAEAVFDDKIVYERETQELIRAYYRIKDPKKRRHFYNLLKSMAEENEE